MKKQLFAAAVVLVAVFVVPLGASMPAPSAQRSSSGGEIIEQVLVKVNGDILTKTELEQRQVAVIRQKINGQVDPDALKNDETLKKMITDITPQLLVNSIDELLLLQHGKELGYHMSDDQFKQIVGNIRKEQHLEKDADFQKALDQENMTMDDLRKQLERQMLIEQVQRQEIGSKLQITEEEARQYYARHPEEFTEPASVTLREIFVEVPTTGGNVNAAKDQDAQKKINDLRARALKAEDFGKLAAEGSDSPSKANGGLIGPFSRADMSPQLQQLVDKMKPGEITQPIRTPKGYQIFQLESVKPEALQPFDSVRDLISEKVANARTQAEMKKFLARLRTQAIIEWKNEDLKKAYEKQIAAEQAGSNQ